MVIEYKQVCTVIHRGRWVGIDNAEAHIQTLAGVIGVDDAERSALFAGILGIAYQLRIMSVERQDNHLLLIHTVDTPIIVPAMLSKVG